MWGKQQEDLKAPLPGGPHVYKEREFSISSLHYRQMTIFKDLKMYQSLCNLTGLKRRVIFWAD